MCSYRGIPNAASDENSINMNCAAELDASRVDNTATSEASVTLVAKTSCPKFVIVEPSPVQPVFFLPWSMPNNVQDPICIAPLISGFSGGSPGHSVTSSSRGNNQSENSTPNALDSPSTNKICEDIDDDEHFQHECKWDGCQEVFAMLQQLVNHIGDAHIKPECFSETYKCHWEGCPRNGKGFNARYKILVHVRMHTNEKPHKCLLCHKSFSRLENLKIHNRTHTGEKPYVCPYKDCKKAYSNSSDRFKHTLTHSTEKPYSCKVPNCNKRYTDPSSLRKHARVHGHHKVVKQTVEETALSGPVDMTFDTVDGEEVAAGVTVSSSVNSNGLYLSSAMSSASTQDTIEEPYGLIANPLLSAVTTSAVTSSIAKTTSQGLTSDSESLLRLRESPSLTMTALPAVPDGSKILLLSSTDLT